MTTSAIRRSARCLAGALSMTPLLASAAWDQLNLTRGVTPYSEIVYDLHMLVLWVCVITGIGVFGAIFYSILKFRKSKGAVPANWHENTFVEFLWTAVPAVILVAVAVPATKALVMMEDVSNSDMTIKVTGLQWRWRYDYLAEGVHFYSGLARTSDRARQLNSGIDPKTVENYLLEVDNELVLPVGKKIRFLTTASDVIHAWWVPALGWKRDAIPGYINESWALIKEPGVYRGQCAELCGKDHGFMPIVVRALPEAEYKAWVEKIKAAQAPKTAAAANARAVPIAAAQ